MKHTHFFRTSLLMALLCLCGADVYAQIPELDYAPRVRTLLCYNIKNAMDDDGKMDFADVVSTIQGCNADVVAIQELDSVTKRSKGLDVLRELALLSQYYPVYGASISYGGGKYGVGILSRERPVSVRQIALPGREEERTLLMAEFDDFVICFAHTNDNCGPQSADEIINIYKDIQKKYPGCELQAATLNDVAKYVEKLENIPKNSGIPLTDT